MKLTDAARALEALADGQPHAHTELYELQVIVHSRVSDLRRLGYQVDRTQQTDTRTGRQVHLYRLAAAPPAPTRLEEQLDRAGAWAAVGLLRRLRDQTASPADDGAIPPAPPSASTGEDADPPSVSSPGPLDEAREELELIEGELAAIAAQPTVADGDLVVELHRRRDVLEAQVCAPADDGRSGAPSGGDPGGCPGSPPTLFDGLAAA